MNILEWALDGTAMGNHFDRVDGGWHIETEKLPGGYANGCLSYVVEYFKEDLGLVPGCHHFEECSQCCNPRWHGDGNSIPIGGYVWPDGRVGINHWMHKLPDISEIIVQLMDWTLCFPYFDIILVITKWDEISAQRAKAKFWQFDEEYDGVPHPDADLDEYEKPYEPITVDDVDICIGIQPGSLRFLKPEDGLRQLAEYDSFYTERERREFPTTDFYWDTDTSPIGEAYFSRLLNYYGEMPEEIREYLLQKFRESTRKGK